MAEERDTFEFPVVGTPYTEVPSKFIESLESGTLVKLVPEPDNVYDEYAVMVFIEDVRVGYVPNKGLSCPKCAIPVRYNQTFCTCPECGEEAVKGGMAFRLHVREAFPDNYACFVEKVDPSDERVPIRLKLYVQPAHFSTISRQSD